MKFSGTTLILLLTGLLVLSCTSKNNAKNDQDQAGIPNDNDISKTDDNTTIVDNNPVADNDFSGADDVESDETDATDIDTNTGPGDKTPVEVDGDPWAGMLERVPYVWQNTKPEQSSDPEGIKELWYRFKIDEKWPLTECTPSLYDQCAENYPHEAVIRAPCEEKALVNPKIAQNSYDYVMTPYCWFISQSDFPYFSVQDKFISFIVNNANIKVTGTFLFDIENKKLQRIGRPIGEAPVYSGKYFVGHTYNYGIVWDNNPDADKVPYYYDTQEKKYGHIWKMKGRLALIRNTAISDTHVIMNMYYMPTDGDDKIHTFYTKVGEWNKWHEINFGVKETYGIGRSELQGSYMISQNEDIRVFFCDLAKGESSCRFVSNDGELARRPVWGAPNIFYYSVEKTTGEEEFFKGTITNGGADIQTTSLFAIKGMAGIQDADSEYVLYWKRIKEDQLNVYNSPCYYRLSDKKQICLEDGVNSGIVYGELQLYKHWLVFQSNEDLILRDMDGYCQQYPANCPFESAPPTSLVKKKSDTN